MERQSEPALGQLLGSFGNFVSGHFDIYDQALHHRTIFTNTIIRWADVDEVRFGKVKTYNTFIPTGTFVDVKVRDRFGQKVSVSDYVMRIDNIDTLAELILAKSIPPIRQDARRRLAAGETLSFGPIRFDSQAITIKGMFRSKIIQLEFLLGWGVDAGNLYIFKVGDKRTPGTPISDIPNFFVLKELLASLSPEGLRRE